MVMMLMRMMWQRRQPAMWPLLHAAVPVAEVPLLAFSNPITLSPAAVAASRCLPSRFYTHPPTCYHCCRALSSSFRTHSPPSHVLLLLCIQNFVVKTLVPEKFMAMARTRRAGKGAAASSLFRWGLPGSVQVYAQVCRV
jgi:hypothetical protein